MRLADFDVPDKIQLVMVWLAVIWMILYTITLVCFARPVAVVVAGWTRATTGLATGGVVGTGSRSSFRKSVLKPKQLWTPVLRNLVLSPVPIRRSGANFL